MKSSVSYYEELILLQITFLAIRKIPAEVTQRERKNVRILHIVEINGINLSNVLREIVKQLCHIFKICMNM